MRKIKIKIQPERRLGVEERLIDASLLCLGRASLVVQTVKNLPSMQETPVLSLGREDPLEKEMISHSSILSWRILWTVEPGGLQRIGTAKSRARLSD